MATTQIPNSTQTSRVRRAALASSIGTAIEAYDFQIYGVASALVFSHYFFSDVPDSLGSILAFGTLAVGFFARPLGAIIFGHFGDRLSRRTALVVTLLGAGACTVLMGLLPGQSTAGLAAPILLVTLRLLQGIFHGGEQGGAVLMAVEHAPANRRGWYGSWAFLGNPGGTLLASSIISLTTAATGGNFLTWGWRIPFLLSIALLAVGFYIRRRVDESPVFAEVKNARSQAKAPLIDVLRNNWRTVLAATGVNIGFNAFIWVLISYSLAYGTKVLGVDKQFMLNGNLLGSVAMMVAILWFARLSDRVGRLPVMLGGAMFACLYAFPMFALFESRSAVVIALAMVGGFIGLSALFGPMAAALVEMFPTRVAYSGVSLGYSFGAVFGGGLAPFVASIITSAVGGAYWGVATYLSCMGLVSLGSLIYLARRQAPASSGRRHSPLLD
ncbi:MHS family MFS transporter [Micrococcales bacterium 31B]|nr:MHS family MFS transporter [Micrococcales bacterium 31B]